MRLVYDKVLERGWRGSIMAESASSPHGSRCL